MILTASHTPNLEMQSHHKWHKVLLGTFVREKGFLLTNEHFLHPQEEFVNLYAVCLKVATKNPILETEHRLYVVLFCVRNWIKMRYYRSSDTPYYQDMAPRRNKLLRHIICGKNGITTIIIIITLKQTYSRQKAEPSETIYARSNSGQLMKMILLKGS